MILENFGPPHKTTPNLWIVARYVPKGDQRTKDSVHLCEDSINHGVKLQEKKIRRKLKILLHDLLIRLDEANYSTKSEHANLYRIPNIDRKRQVPRDILANWVSQDIPEE